MIVALDQEKEISPAKTISSLEVDRIVDFPSLKTVRVFFKHGENLVLWKGEEYDAVGQWTDEDAKEKIKELYELL